MIRGRSGSARMFVAQPPPALRSAILDGWMARSFSEVPAAIEIRLLPKSPTDEIGPPHPMSLEGAGVKALRILTRFLDHPRDDGRFIQFVASDCAVYPMDKGGSDIVARDTGGAVVQEGAVDAQRVIICQDSARAAGVSEGTGRRAFGRLKRIVRSTDRRNTRLLA